MKANFKERLGSWRGVADAARTTINMEAGTGEPSSLWKKRMLRCEHSPTRQLRYSWKWYDLKYWVSVHLVRHKFGIEHFVGTQRDDRNDNAVSRDDAPQGTFVTHQVEANAQSIINISRKRLCTGASPETRQAWQAALEEIRLVDPELYESSVPECVYRNGYCPEFKCCGYNQTPHFEEALKKYLEGFEDQVNKKTLIK